jgi:SAM-dependent methyltransferase
MRTWSMANLWDERYTEHEAAFGNEPNDFLVKYAPRIPLGIGPVLCLGDGQGRNGVYLASLGHEVVSIDLSAVGLAGAERLAAERGVSISTVVADLAEYQPPSGCAAVVSIFCHMPSRVRALAYPRLVAALRPGGFWLHESYSVAQVGRGTGGPSDPDLLPSGTRLQQELTGLTHLFVREIERPVLEGPLHTGDAVVVQYLGAVGDPRAISEG